MALVEKENILAAGAIERRVKGRPHDFQNPSRHQGVIAVGIG